MVMMKFSSILVLLSAGTAVGFAPASGPQKVSTAVAATRAVAAKPKAAAKKSVGEVRAVYMGLHFSHSLFCPSLVLSRAYALTSGSRPFLVRIWPPRSPPSCWGL